MISRILFFIGCGVFMIACRQAGEQYDKPYFDFDSLINAQHAALLQQPVALSKTVVLDGKQDQSSFPLDSARLAHELDVFRQLDLINKPLYAKAYQISDGEKDRRSNLTIRKYTARNPAPIPGVTFYYQDRFDQLRKIESDYNENNTLYSTHRKLVLEFDNSSGKFLLTRYRLTGSQKMVLSDSVQYTIEGVLH